MKIDDFKERIDLVDERVVALVRRYPLVFITLVVVSGLVGFALGNFL